MTTPSQPHQSRAGKDAIADPVSAVYGPRPERPASGGPPSVRRPPEMLVGAVFLTLAALPAMACGVLLGLLPGNVDTNLRARINATRTTVNTDLLVGVFRAAGLVILLLAVLFVLFAWLTVRPRRGARLVATTLAALEVVLLVAAMVVAGVDPVSLGIALLAVVGTVLLYLPRSTGFLLAHR